MKTLDIEINKEWTLFLDRDGTINKLLPEKYVKHWSEFEFLPGAIEAISFFNKIFGRVIVVTNQQGIGKEMMTHEDLSKIHEQMIEHMSLEGAYIDEIYYCPELAIYNPSCRKPNPGMAFKAKEDFPDIEFKKAIMIGDEETDIVFGNGLSMFTVKINRSSNESEADVIVDSLYDFYRSLNS